MIQQHLLYQLNLVRKYKHVEKWSKIFRFSMRNALHIVCQMIVLLNLITKILCCQNVFYHVQLDTHKVEQVAHQNSYVTQHVILVL
jgi:hypothetical protein